MSRFVILLSVAGLMVSFGPAGASEQEDRENDTAYMKVCLRNKETDQGSRARCTRACVDFAVKDGQPRANAERFCVPAG